MWQPCRCFYSSGGEMVQVPSNVFLHFFLHFCAFVWFQAPFIPEFFFEYDNSKMLSLFNDEKTILSEEEIDAYRYTFTKG